MKRPDAGWRALALPVLRFELAYQLRRPAFWIVALLFGGIGFIDMVSNGGRGNAFFFVNSPSQVLQTTVWYTLFGVLAATAFVAEAFVRDRRSGMEPLVLATRLRKRELVGMRFAAAFRAALLAFSAFLPGMVAGSLMPGLNPYAIGPLRGDAYALAWFGFALPNLLFVSVFAFVVASRARSIAAAYGAAVVLVMVHAAALLMVGVDSIDQDQLAWWSLFDPYGHFALESSTQTWTVHQHNTAMPAFDAVLLANRALWVGVALAAWLLAYRFHDMRPVAERGARPARRTAPRMAAPPVPAQSLDGPLPLPGWRSFAALAAFELQLVLRSRVFQVLSFCGLVSLFFAASGSRSFEHANPSTDILVQAAGLYFRYVLFALVVLQAAEMSWRGRDARLQAVIDATPLPGWLIVLPKLAALIAVVLLNMLLCMALLALYQVSHGYFRFEWGLSAQMLFGVQAPYFVFVAALALFCQAVVGNRYAGIALALVVAGSITVLDALGAFHNLYRFGATNDIGWSPMNGWAGLFEGHLWYVAYWAAFCATLVALACLWWPRGAEPRRRGAWRAASKGLRRGIVGGAVLSAALAGWIVFNTAVLNDYQPPGKERLAVEHERRFKQYETLPMPVVVGLQLKADLYPREHRFVAKGRYRLENRSGVPIREIHLGSFLGLQLVDVTLPGGRLVESHPEWGYAIWRLDAPLAPGAQLMLDFVTRTERPPGFRNHVDSDDVYMVAPNEVLDNGTSLYAPFILPFIGYTKMVEHKEAWLRARYGLPPLDSRMRAHDDAVGLARALGISHQTWSDTDMIVGTAGDQTVVGSGNELRRWAEGGRNYVHYRSQAPERGKFTLYSARYARFVHPGARVPIEVYHHPPHADNARAMAGHLAGAMTLYEQLFGAYPFRQLRLAEFAYYPGMVFSEAGTIGLPEVLAWKADIRPGGDGEDAMIGWLAYLLGHAWWDDQLIMADVAGSMTVREALSGYASNLYRRSIYSPQRFARVKQQQMRNYFRALGQVDFEEPPLVDVYNEVLVARFKGQMVLEQVEALIGQPALLAAIRGFTEDFKQRPAPYATVLDLRDAVLARTPAALREQVGELFGRVVSYRFAVLDASRQPHAAGWRLTLRVEAAKLLSSGLGEHSVREFDLPLTLAVIDARGRTLLRRVLQPGTLARPIVVDTAAEPARVVLDPDCSLPTAASPQRGRAL